VKRVTCLQQVGLLVELLVALLAASHGADCMTHKISGLASIGRSEQYLGINFRSQVQQDSARYACIPVTRLDRGLSRISGVASRVDLPRLDRGSAILRHWGTQSRKNVLEDSHSLPR